MVSVKINFKKKDLWLLSAIVVFLVGVGYVIATGSTPQINGHSYSELQTCADGQILKMSGGVWACAADDVGGGVSGISSCRVVKSIEGTNEPVVLCCDSNEFAIGVNDPELDSRAFFSTPEVAGISFKLNTGDVPSCVGFDAVNGGVNNPLQIICCK